VRRRAVAATATSPCWREGRVTRNFHGDREWQELAGWSPATSTFEIPVLSRPAADIATHRRGRPPVCQDASPSDHLAYDVGV